MVGVGIRPWKGMGIHRMDSAPEKVVGREMLVGKCSAEENSWV